MGVYEELARSVDWDTQEADERELLVGREDVPVRAEIAMRKMQLRLEALHLKKDKRCYDRNVVKYTDAKFPRRFINALLKNAENIERETNKPDIERRAFIKKMEDMGLIEDVSWRRMFPFEEKYVMARKKERQAAALKQRVTEMRESSQLANQAYMARMAKKEELEKLAKERKNFLLRVFFNILFGVLAHLLAWIWFFPNETLEEFLWGCVPHWIFMAVWIFVVIITVASTILFYVVG